MRGRDAFSGYHPLVNFLYFAAVLGCSMLLLHPLCLAISLLASISYSVYLNGRRAVRFGLLYMLPLLLLTALLNPAFNHEGVTILTYLPSGNPLTLESILYGLAAAAMLIATITWFACFGAIITSDKFVYLFGRIIPALSLLLSMALRFVPRFRAQSRAVADARRGVGRDAFSGGLFNRVRDGATILSILVTWSLENSIETADSMRSRGYGLPGRSAFSIYRFERRDGCALLWLLGSTAYLIVGCAMGALRWRYFPSVQGAPAGLFQVTVLAAYLALCLTPHFLNLREDCKWKPINSPT